MIATTSLASAAYLKPTTPRATCGAL
ncbi:hypothetical protein CGRA01v4_02984 [Colletotrichum graminicola]|nr:hypothetical protein CGRA01v4_02984 [Colletotrichum graminicola]